jgi:hypothetical protein
MAIRYRCTACGNLTRFDVVSTRRTRAYHHYSVGGELVVEEEQVLAETIEDVSCRWCGSGHAVVALDDSDDSGDADDTTALDDAGEAGATGGTVADQAGGDAAPAAEPPHGS